MDATHAAAGDRLARRNALILSLGQALGGSQATVIIATGGIVGATIAPVTAWATLPISAFVVGQALATAPASLLQRRIGRRAGFIFGAGLGFLGGVLCVAGLVLAHFWLFCLGTLFAGFYGGHIQLYRFAAADTASDAFRPRAISWVLAGGVAAAIVGPQLVIFTRDMFAPYSLAGPFAAVALLAVVAAGILTFLRIPLPPKAGPGGGSTGTPMSEILRQPRFVVAVLCGMATYALMTLVMTAAPLAMLGCGFGVGEAALGIQWHALAMFAPSFVTGRLISRFGKPRIIAAGLLLLAGCGAVALAGIELAHFWGALVLLGFGWNLGFIGATAMVTDCHRPEERNKVQGFNDVCVFGCVALSSFLSGSLLDVYGWESVNLAVFPAVIACLGLLGWLMLLERRSIAA
ncbi:MFS transporter [Lutibaculum baratangense]|uniref:Major facilitator superfamily (MFS) profile domain-containing protein n=1 Tax=Lutibaculum baratangense AMV1 TaxID=631454 RepID=V4T9U7_9HYPH|nr:MFS transporter [Lutibaculum baratangense]ESR23273.1 hypothetical protein N177_3341 [Lutibaculum baratangense AMV1]